MGLVDHFQAGVIQNNDRVAVSSNFCFESLMFLYLRLKKKINLKFECFILILFIPGLHEVRERVIISQKREIISGGAKL